MADGTKSLFQGLKPTLVVQKCSIFQVLSVAWFLSQGQVFYSGLSFSTFETLKAFFADEHGELTTPLRFGSGAVAGVIAQSGPTLFDFNKVPLIPISFFSSRLPATYPLDVVRRRMQIDPIHAPRYRGIVDALVTIYRTEGLIAGNYKVRL